MSGDCVDWVIGLIDLHVECKSLDSEIHDDGEQGGEQCTEHIVLTTILAHLDHLGNDEAHNIHPCNCAGEGKTRYYGVERLGLQLESDTRNKTRHLLFDTKKNIVGVPRLNICLFI